MPDLCQRKIPANSPKLKEVVPIDDPSNFDEEVDELVERIAPKASCQRTVEELAAIAREKMQSIVPEVNVMGFANGDLCGGMAYGVAVPEADIVAIASPSDLITRLQEHSRQRSMSSDSHKLQKSAIRAFSRLLVSVGFKFRRSSFQSEEPKVTLLAPVSLGISSIPIPIELSVNNMIPLYTAALLTECGQIDARARSLILLVRRWAKDRGVCRANKGHLPPYAWCLLVIFYLQVGMEELDGNLPLPPLREFAIFPGLSEVGEEDPESVSSKPVSMACAPKMSVGALFKGFARFYNKDFDWCTEAVSVLRGERGAPSPALEVRTVIHDDGETAVSPTVEDPFDAKRNLGNCTTSTSLRRFLEEFERADRLLHCDTTLAEILEPWKSPDHAGDNSVVGHDEEIGNDA
jgi:hypothetical protein